eukprot:g7871.t1
MGEPKVMEILPSCIKAFDKVEIEVHLEWEVHASAVYSILFMKDKETLAVESLYENQTSVIWNTGGMTPGILNIVIIEEQEHNCNLTSVSPVSVLPAAATLEMMKVFENIQTLAMGSPDEDDYFVSRNSSSSTFVRQYIWENQIKPFTMDLEFLLNGLEQKNVEDSELFDVIRNVGTFLIELNALETLRFVLETCADYNISYSWGPTPVSSDEGLIKLYEMVKFQYPNEQNHNSSTSSSSSSINEVSKEIDVNNLIQHPELDSFSGNYQMEQQQQQQQQQQLQEQEIFEHCQVGEGGGDVSQVGGVRLEASSDDLTSDPKLLHDEIWRPVPFSAALPVDASFASKAFSSTLHQSSPNQHTCTELEGHDLNTLLTEEFYPVPSQTATTTTAKDEEELMEIDEGDNKSSIKQNLNRAHSGSNIAVPGTDVLGETMATVDAHSFLVSSFLLSISLCVWLICLKIWSLFEIFQGSGFLLSSISTVLILLLFKKLVDESYVPKLDYMSGLILILIVVGSRVSLITQHCHSEESSRIICFVHTIQAIVWLGVWLKTRPRIALHYQFCLLFINIAMFFIISHYSDNYCPNGNCLTIFTTNLIGEISSLLLASIADQFQEDKSAKKRS